MGFPAPMILAPIDNANEISDGSSLTGWMMLVRTGSSVDLIWHPAPQSIPDFLPIPDSAASQWAVGTFTRASHDQIDQISLESDDSSISITWKTTTPSESARTFQIPLANFCQLTRFIEQLILNRVAAPLPGLPSLLFCVSPPHTISDSAIAQMIDPTFHTFADFWASVLRFFNDAVCVLDDLHLLTSPFSYEAALASQSQLISEVNASLDSTRQGGKITELDSLFDADGRLLDPKAFFSRLFLSGAEPASLPIVVPFALGLFPPGSSSEERVAIEKTFTTQYETVRKRHEGRDKLGLPSIGRTKEIHDDVVRTPSVFCGLTPPPLPPGGQMLEGLLHDYAVHNPEIGYVQGMSVMLSFFVLAFVDHWDASGVPLGKGGEDCVGEISPIVFCCFGAMIERLGYAELVKDIELCRVWTRAGMDLVRKESKLMGFCLSESETLVLGLEKAVNGMAGSTGMDVWRLWLHFWCAPEPSRWWPYFIAGFFLHAFHVLLPRGGEHVSVIDVFAAMDLDFVVKAAIWFYQRHPPDNLAKAKAALD
jgi:hypothetical protein